MAGDSCPAGHQPSSFLGSGRILRSFWSPWGCWPNGGTRSISQVSCVSTNGTLPSVTSWSGHVPLSQPPHGRPQEGCWAPGWAQSMLPANPCQNPEKYHPTSSQTNSHTQPASPGSRRAGSRAPGPSSTPTPAIPQGLMVARGAGHIHTARVSGHRSWLSLLGPADSDRPGRLAARDPSSPPPAETPQATCGPVWSEHLLSATMCWGLSFPPAQETAS